MHVHTRCAIGFCIYVYARSARQRALAVAFLSGNSRTCTDGMRLVRGVEGGAIALFRVYDFRRTVVWTDALGLEATFGALGFVGGSEPWMVCVAAWPRCSHDKQCYPVFASTKPKLYSVFSARLRLYAPFFIVTIY
jgi:hypothetical protein